MVEEELLHQARRRVRSRHIQPLLIGVEEDFQVAQRLASSFGFAEDGNGELNLRIGSFHFTFNFFLGSEDLSSAWTVESSGRASSHRLVASWAFHVLILGHDQFFVNNYIFRGVV